ncbi:MAG: helix-turn-helix domain-containing protein [Hyphomicrobium sp.]|jgi:CRP-like cAMP-binding protein
MQNMPRFNAPDVIEHPTASAQRARRPVLPTTSTAIHAKRSIIFDEGQSAEAIFQVVSGAVILSRAVQGHPRRVLDVVGPGGMLGVVSGPRYNCRAETLTRSVIRRVSRSSVDGSEVLQRLVGRALTRNLEKLHDEATMRARMSAKECVAALILTLPPVVAQPAGRQKQGADYRLALPLSDMASYLGLAIATVCRAMKSLKHMGAIQASGREWIAIIDEAALLRLAAAGQVANAAV